MRGGSGQRGTPFDWTLSPAKWGAAGALALLGACGLAWSVIRAEGGGPGTGAQVRALERDAGAGPSHVPQPRPATLMGDGRITTDAGVSPSDAIAPGGTGLSAPMAIQTPDPINTASSGDAGTGAARPGVSPAEPAQPAEPQPTIARRIDINTASEAELQLLPGIGAARARAIIDDRRARGRFRSVDELDRVQGIGAGIIAGLRDFARAG